MSNQAVRLSREADLVLENLKLKLRQESPKKIYKRDIVNFLVLEMIHHPGCLKKMERWFKEQK